MYKNSSFLDKNERNWNETEKNKTKLVHTKDQNKTMDIGIIIFITGMLILILGIIILIVTSKIF